MGVAREKGILMGFTEFLECAEECEDFFADLEYFVLEEELNIYEYLVVA